MTKPLLAIVRKRSRPVYQPLTSITQLKCIFCDDRSSKTNAELQQHMDREHPRWQYRAINELEKLGRPSALKVVP